MTDFKTLKLTRKPNQYLVAPEGYTPMAKPHRISTPVAVPPKDLLDKFLAYALSQPKVTVTSKRPDGLGAELIQRTKIMNFPDLISVEAIAVPAGSALVIYSRSRYGYRDFGVNKKRIDTWLDAVLPKMA